MPPGSAAMSFRSSANLVCLPRAILAFSGPGFFSLQFYFIVFIPLFDVPKRARTCGTGERMDVAGGRWAGGRWVWHDMHWVMN